MIEKIKQVVGSDILEIFGDTGAGKSKLCLYLSKEAIKNGWKVFYLDTERNLLAREITGLSYKYTPIWKEIEETIERLGKFDLFVLDSIGFPILVNFARYTLRQKGDALLDMIALLGDIKEWCYKNDALAIVVNQPESEFGKPQGYERRPFGDKSRFATKEIWEMNLISSKPTESQASLTAFRSRLWGKDFPIANITISSKGIKAEWLPTDLDIMERKPVE